MAQSQGAIQLDGVKLISTAKPTSSYKGPSPLRKRLAIGAAVVVAGMLAILVALLVIQPWKSAPSWAMRQNIWTKSALHPGLHEATISPDGTLRSLVDLPLDAETNGTLHLEYEAKLNDGMLIFSLDHEEAVLDVGCFNGMLHLVLSPNVALTTALQPGTIISGSHLWECTLSSDMANGTSSKGAHAILHRVTAVAEAPSDIATISMTVEPVGLAELFQTVTLTYHNTLHANASAAAASATATTSGAAARRRRLGWFHNIAEHVDHDVHDAAHDVTHDVTDAAKAVTGDMSVNHQFSLKSFGWTPPASIHVGPVDAKGSYAKLAVGVHFEMEMKDYTVESLEVAAVLSADLKAQAGATFSDGVTRSYTQSLMDDVNLGSITFSIGPVPVHASALVSLAAKASLKANEQVSIATWARETSHATFGVKYSDGEWGKVAETASPTFSYELPTFNAARSATVTVSIQPTIQLSIDFLGGPTVSVVPSLDLKLSDGEEVTLSDVEYSHDCDGVQSTLGWAVAVDVGAKLDLSLPGELSRFDRNFAHWGPKAVYSSAPHVLDSRCID